MDPERKSTLERGSMENRRLNMNDIDRESLSLCIFGGECAGKKTLCHRLMHDAFGLSGNYYRRLVDVAAKKGELACFAHYWNEHNDALARGMTIASMSYECRTETRRFSMTDSPTHRSFTLNHVSGASTIGVSVLVIAANDSELEWERWEGKEDGAAMVCVKASGVDRKGSSFSSLERMKVQLQTLFLVGAHQIIVIVNKMETVSFSQSRFEAAKSLATALLEYTGFSPSFVACGVPIIPVSVLEGDNIVFSACDGLRPGEQFNRMSWWRGYSLFWPCRTVRTVRTLHEALEWLPVPWLERGAEDEESVRRRCVGPNSRHGARLPPPSERARLALRVSLSGVYNINGVGFVVTGRVSQGTLRPNEDVVFVPSGKKARVTSIEVSMISVNEATPGYNCGFQINGEDLTRSTLPAKGELMCFPHDVPKLARRFLVRVRFLPLTQKKLNENLIVDGRVCVDTGTLLTLYFRTSRCPVRIECFIWRRSRETGMMKEPCPERVTLGDEAEAWVLPDQAVLIEPCRICPETGRVVILVDTDCGLLGKVLAVEETD